jgi:predicted alpha/beta-hydrolase family hydrolase
VSAPAGLLLTHGAGGGADHRLLVALEDQLDLPVRRMEFPYRAEGRKAPDRAPKLIASVIELAFGGRSMGGRICSMAIAEGLPAAAVVLLSYPLHPPGKPERLRIEHFPTLAVPSLFVNGDRDPFGTPAEFAEHIPAIAGPVEVHWLEGQRHDPKPDVDDEIIEVVGRFLSGL